MRQWKQIPSMVGMMALKVSPLLHAVVFPLVPAALHYQSLPLPTFL